MSPNPTVIGALRRFLPEFLKTAPPLSAAQHRAIWAITHCRTSALGGNAFGCSRGAQIHFAYHSCNHKACPQCGRQATARWIQRQQTKLVNAPYFLVTFTLPAELRGEFFDPLAKQAFDLFFQAVSGALSENLAHDKNLRAKVHGFSAVLHTWNQQLQFHPHIHCLVPGAGLNAQGQLGRVKQAHFLVYLPHLQAAFRQHLRRLLEQNHCRRRPHDRQITSQPAVLLDLLLHFETEGVWTLSFNPRKGEALCRPRPLGSYFRARRFLRRPTQAP